MPPEKIQGRNSLFTYAPENMYSLPDFVSSAMPSKDLAPFSYIYSTKNPSLMIKYELATSCNWYFSELSTVTLANG